MSISIKDKQHICIYISTQKKVFAKGSNLSLNKWLQTIHKMFAINPVSDYSSTISCNWFAADEDEMCIVYSIINLD